MGQHMPFQRITPERGMLMQKPSGDDLPSDRVPARAPEPIRTRVDDGGGDETLRGIVFGYLGFSG